ncbi:MAG: c-type cytochrome [Chloroflexota bacterium]
MTQHKPSQSNSGALMPVLLLFGGITLMLFAAFVARPSQHTYADMELTGTAVVEAAHQTATAIVQQEIALAATETQQTIPPTATLQEVVQAAQPAPDPAMVSAGENVFQSVCSACHGFNAKGIPGLGKPLIGSQFVNGLSDDDLLAFIQKGREVTDPLNTTGVMMPARGGNPGLTDDDLRHVIAYIRSLNTPSSEVATAPSATPSPSGPTPTAYVFVPLPLSSSGDAATATVESTETAVTGDAIEVATVPHSFASDGEEWYVKSCSGCHGVDGNGVAYDAPSLANSDLLKSRDGIGLLNFLTSVHPPVNPEVAYPHPYRGGYPELSDAQIQAVIVYLYSLPG